MSLKHNDSGLYDDLQYPDDDLSVDDNEPDSSDRYSNEKVLVYNFKSNRTSVMPKRELYRKAGDIEHIDVPLRPGRLPIRLKDGQAGPDIFIAAINLKWQWRLQRWAGNYKTLYVAGSI